MATLKVSQQGKKRIQQARNDKGWTVDDPRWLVEASKILEPHRNWEVESPAFANGVSEGTWKAFLYRTRGITTEVFKAFCQVLELSWEEVKESTGTSVVSQGNHDWHKICREMLESHKQSIRRQATEIVSEPFYVQLGLVERRHQPRRGGDFSLSPEQGSGFFQLDKEEIIETYEHDEFLEQVIKQGQSKKSQGKRIAIIGEPGAGKTTLLEAISLTACFANAFSPKTPGFPIWISLSSLGDKSLEEYLCQKWLKDALKTSDVTQQEKALEELFKSGEVLLLLDGVDEMPAPSPVQALAKIREELTGWVASARVVLTCRVNVWDANHNALQGFDTYRTLEFSYGDGNKPDQVKEFICQWFSNTDKPELGEALREKLDKERHQRIRDLVKNPLRLSLLCQSWYFHQGDLPKTKAALYEQFTQAFYEWKKEPHSTTLTQRKELNTALGLLAREAIDKEKSRFGIRRHFALDIMGEYLFNLATEKLNWLVHVYNDADTGQPVYAFFHPTFQEYFAACAIDDWDYFLNHIPDNPAQGTYRIFERQWKEVILLWLGRDDVPKHKKEDFIATLVNFEDDCWDFYWYRAFFLAAAGIDELKDCIDADWADWIVAKLVEYATEEPYTGVDRVVNPAIWATLLETNRARAINVLIEVLESSFLDEEVRWKVFNSLIQIGTANSKVIAALNKLMDTSLDDKELPLEAAFFLGKINPEKREAVKFLEQQLWNTFLPDWVRHKAAYFLGKIDQGNGEAINFLTELIERNKSLDLGAASTLGKIDPGNHTAIETLTELLKTERGDRFLNIPLIAARNLLEIDPENPEAIRVLREFIKPGHKRWERLEAASALGKTKQGKKEAIKVLCELMHEAVEIAQDIRLSKAVISSLYQIDRRILEPSPGWVQRTFSGEDDLEYVAAQIAFSKYCLSQEINIDVENSNYEIMWFLAQITAYPIFYQAWHGEPSLAQTLEKQVSDIPSQVQPTDKTYPIAIDAQTLKLETNTSAIAQKLCTKIYHKAGYSDIPTVSDAAQLQQYIPRIQEKLQKPNLALILHGCEPNEHLINFCYSLADPDIGFHIGLITSKPIEQPLKGFLPNQDNLLSAIQTWINEIG